MARKYGPAIPAATAREALRVYRLRQHESIAACAHEHHDVVTEYACAGCGHVWEEDDEDEDEDDAMRAEIAALDACLARITDVLREPDTDDGYKVFSVALVLQLEQARRAGKQGVLLIHEGQEYTATISGWDAAMAQQ